MQDLVHLIQNELLRSKSSTLSAQTERLRSILKESSLSYLLHPSRLNRDDFRRSDNKKIKKTLVFAATGAESIYNPAVDPKVGTGEGAKIFGDFVSRGIKLALYLGMLSCFFYLFWGGFQWITSGGEKEGVAAAKQRITAAVVGLTILASVWAIVLLLEKFLGITILGGPIKLPTP